MRARRSGGGREAERAPMEPPAKRSKLGRGLGAKGVPASWATTPSVPWPGTKAAQEGVRYHVDEDGEREYWLFRSKQRRPVCICQPDGKCGLEATSKTCPGYALGCALREDRKAAYEKAKKANGGALPAWEGQKAHKGKEDFVLHRGRECVTMPCNGQARPLCKCGACFLTCRNFKHAYAIGCLYNDAPKCKECPAVATTQGYCATCAKRVGATAKRKAEREPELQALMDELGIARAPDDANDATAGTPYAQQNPQADYAPHLVVRTGNGKGGFMWLPGCRHGIHLANCTTCNTLEQLQQSKRFCSVCTKWLQRNTYKSGTGLCVECGKAEGEHQRTEIRLRKHIDARVPFESSCLDDTMFGTDTKHCDVNKRRRPDNGWFYTDRAILLETDEGGGHCRQCYSAQCDSTWMTDMATSIEGAMTKAGLDGTQVRVFVIRFNPDERDQHLPQVREEQRLDAVCALVNNLRTLSTEELAAYDPLVPHVWYYYYHSKCADKIAHARTSGGIRVVDVIH